MDVEKIMQFVRGELEKDPEQPSGRLFEKAKEIDRKVRELTVRQFHARFPLQVKRRLAMEGGKKGSGNGRTTRARTSRASKAASSRPGRKERRDASDRDAVRQAFLRFATDLSAAGEDRGALVGVLAGVDGYVDDVMGAVGGGRAGRK